MKALFYSILLQKIYKISLKQEDKEKNYNKTIKKIKRVKKNPQLNIKLCSNS